MVILIDSHTFDSQVNALSTRSRAPLMMMGHLYCYNKYTTVAHTLKCPINHTVTEAMWCKGQHTCFRYTRSGSQLSAWLKFSESAYNLENLFYFSNFTEWNKLGASSNGLISDEKILLKEGRKWRKFETCMQKEGFATSVE